MFKLDGAVLLNGCDAAKSLSVVHMCTWFRYFFFPTLLLNTAWHSQTEPSVAIAFRTIILIDSAAEPVGTLSPLTQRHTLDLITAVPSLTILQCSRLFQGKYSKRAQIMENLCMKIMSQSAGCFRPSQRTERLLLFFNVAHKLFENVTL